MDPSKLAYYGGSTRLGVDATSGLIRGRELMQPATCLVDSVFVLCVDNEHEESSDAYNSPDSDSDDSTRHKDQLLKKRGKAPLILIQPFTVLARRQKNSRTIILVPDELLAEGDSSSYTRRLARTATDEAFVATNLRRQHVVVESEPS